MAAVTVSQSDLASYNLQQEVANYTTLISQANTAGNYPLAMQLTRKQVQKQNDLVYSLLAVGSISAATILAGNAVTYALPAWLASGRQPAP